MTKRILITGSSGAIGRPVCRHLLELGHQVRGLDLIANPELGDQVVADLSDRELVRQAVSGMDTVLHLAAYPDDADFIDHLLAPNVLGLYHVCDAAANAGVGRLVLASSLQVISGLKAKHTIGIADGAAPTNHYALTKVWAEQMGQMYARVHKLSVILVRIGWFPRNTGEARRLVDNPRGQQLYLSHPDAARFFQCCVEADAPHPGHAETVFATSLPATSPRLDLEPARRLLGYVPEDTWPGGMPFAH